jgi:ACS family hexuronate transporter-like MFS transporter
VSDLGPMEPLGTSARIGRLTLLFLAHSIGTANITLVLAMAPMVQRELGLSHSTFGVIVAAYYGALTVWALPTGWLVDRFNIRVTLVAAQVLQAIGMIVISKAHGLSAAATGLALCGTGYALVNPSTARGVLRWFPARGRATAMGVLLTGVPVGGAAMALVAAAGAEAWRDLALVLATMTLVAGAAFTTFDSARPATAAATSLTDLQQLLRRSPLGWFNAAGCFYAGAQGAFFAYIVLFVYEAFAADATLASLCLAVAYTASAIGRIGWGLVGDVVSRHGRWVGLIACGIFGTVGAALLAMIPAMGPGAVVAVAGITGFALGGYAALTLTTAVEMVEPQLAGTAIGYHMLLITTGSMLGPALFGHSVDLFGYTPTWFALAGVLVVGTALFLIAFHQLSVKDPKAVERLG